MTSATEEQANKLSELWNCLHSKVSSFQKGDGLSKVYFSDIEPYLTAKSISVIKDLKLEYLTTVQVKTLCLLLSFVSVDIVSKTGSGKTLAYLLPIFENLARAKFKHTYGTGAIIIAPTRELCTQIHDLASKFAVKHSRSCVLLISGSGGFNDEQRKLHKGAAIVIATPGRLLQHLEESEKVFSFKVLVTVVLDEADRMIKDGFTSQLKQIFNKLRESNETMNLKRSASTSNSEPVLFPRQVITATATVSTEVNELLSILNVPARRSVDIVTSKKFVTNSTLNQKYMVVSSENRLSVLINFLRVHRESKIMVFMSTCKCVSFYQCVLSSVFAFDNIVTLSGQMEQKERLKIFFNFCKTSQLILICTDVAARGLDIKSVDYIIQYDAPYSAQDYIHRVGRTARAGSAGRSILFLRQEELTFCEVLIKHKILIKEQPNVKFLHPDCNIQLQEFLDTNAYLYEMAVNAFRTYLRFYNSYPNKSCFDISKLDFQNLSYSFGFRKRPDISGLGLTNPRQSKQNQAPKRFKYITPRVTTFESDHSEEE